MAPATQLYTTNGVNFYDGTKIASTAAGTTGQCLVATTGSAPTWQSCSTAAGTPTTLAGDVTGALGSNTVSKLQGNVPTTTPPWPLVRLAGAVQMEWVGLGRCAGY